MAKASSQKAPVDARLVEADEAVTEARRALAAIYDATNEFSGDDGIGLIALIKYAASHASDAAYRAETILDELTKAEAPNAD